jgi:hypothetical protein
MCNFYRLKCPRCLVPDPRIPIVYATDRCSYLKKNYPDQHQSQCPSLVEINGDYYGSKNCARCVAMGF